MKLNTLVVIPSSQQAHASSNIIVKIEEDLKLHHPILFSNIKNNLFGEDQNSDEFQQHKMMQILQIKKKKNYFAKLKPPKVKKQKEIIQKSTDLKKGHWSLEQSKRYHWFLEIYSQHFIQKYLRRLDKIFKTMATFIGTRQAEQCRSHHQKMQKKYNNFYKIVINLRKRFYGSYEASIVIKDLKDNGFTLQSSILQAEELQNQPKIRQNCSLSEEKEEDQLMIRQQNHQFLFKNDENIQHLDHIQAPSHENSMLQDEYQNKLDINFN